MKYDDSHVRDFEGAVGVCDVCGLEIKLDEFDKPHMPLPRVWIVKCPHCATWVRCYTSIRLSE
jgi:hypothetical protein